MALVEAYDGRATGQRWDWVLSRLKVAGIGKDEARQARRLLADATLPASHKTIGTSVPEVPSPVSPAVFVALAARDEPVR